MQAILPHYLRQLQEDSKKASLNNSALKHELHVLTTLMVEMKVLINCCDVLARYLRIFFVYFYLTCILISFFVPETLADRKETLI